MNKNIISSIFVLVLASLSLAAIYRNEDPIRDTQTDPIAYQQKMEEEKDGKKGALLYSVKYNPSDNFLTASPVAEEEKVMEPVEAEENTWTEASWWEEVPVSGDEASDDGQEAPAQDVEDSQWWQSDD